jgi:hypothetical protein
MYPSNQKIIIGHKPDSARSLTYRLRPALPPSRPSLTFATTQKLRHGLKRRYIGLTIGPENLVVYGHMTHVCCEMGHRPPCNLRKGTSITISVSEGIAFCGRFYCHASDAKDWATSTSPWSHLPRFRALAVTSREVRKSL